MLSGNCSEWSTDRAYIPCPTVTIVKWCHTVMQTVRQHQEGGRWTSTKKKKLWLKIEKLTNILTSEAILQPSRTSMADHSCRNSERLKSVNYSRRKEPPQFFFWALNMPLYLIWLSYLKKCVSTKKLYKQKAASILTNYGLPIKWDLISRDKQCASNNTEINSPSNHVL